MDPFREHFPGDNCTIQFVTGRIATETSREFSEFSIRFNSSITGRRFEENRRRIVRDWLSQLIIAKPEIVLNQGSLGPIIFKIKV